ncbi:hypothetical protein V1511DRAFT_49792 [Dipodascopsis uninucleata]
MSSLLFDDLFTVTTVDSKRYDRVSRITGTSNTSDIHLTLDLNTELFPVSQGEVLSIAIAKSLSLIPESSSTTSGWREPKPGERGLADDYDYVMYGTVYKFEEGKNENIAAYVSFGGLLLCLEGGYKKLASLRQETVYLLVRR